ncbi:hypothetical protein CA952_17865 [Raoultella ornithinolytica]|uniref:Uncharacterized protein n=2 Tax=Klebsiella/Raoultella group TaxID=2890311 RepID=A0A1B1LQQ2_KLEPN|nr:hypothetical protein pKpNDM1_00252 [Raoultella planticola]ANS55392.1 hypothetical protein [Klebsiella pneumoniae]ASI57137.1 hypothetical protein CA210_02400 [Raoultella ornithinolytica]KYT22214.1 hypothetical protein AML48_22940 [Escherichia coli]QHO84554.1 hypothetical protein CHQ91_00990 [Klebsiella michiganensis]
MPLLLFDNAWGILTWSLVVFLELIFKQQPRPFCKQKVRAYLENKGVVLALLCVYTEPYIAQYERGNWTVSHRLARQHGQLQGKQKGIIGRRPAGSKRRLNLRRGW